MAWKFGDQVTLVPTLYEEHWRRRGYTGEPCAYFTNPLGVLPGTGEIFLQRWQLDELGVNAPQDLYHYDTSGNNRTFPWILIVRAECLTPGSPKDPNAVYRVHLADRRRRWPLIPCDKGYNLRATAGGSFETSTTNGGTAWTWQGMLADIWALLDEGNLPELPSTPHGTPEGFAFYGMSARDALGHLLDRLDWALSWSPEDDPMWSIVETGAQDTDFDQLVADSNIHRIDDEDPIDPAYGRLPGKVKVLFRNQPEPSDGKSPFTTREIAAPAPAAAGEDAELIAIIHDDLAAIYSGTTNTNATALDARAAARAAEFFRDARGFGHNRKAYVGIRLFWTGSQVTEVRHETDRSGTRTTIARVPRADEWRSNDRPWRFANAGGGSGSIFGQDGIAVATNTPNPGDKTLSLNRITPDGVTVGGGSSNPMSTGFSIDVLDRGSFGMAVEAFWAEPTELPSYPATTRKIVTIHAFDGLISENYDTTSGIYWTNQFRQVDGDWTTVPRFGDFGDPNGLFVESITTDVPGIVASRFGISTPDLGMGGTFNGWGIDGTVGGVDFRGGIAVGISGGGGGSGSLFGRLIGGF